MLLRWQTIWNSERLLVEMQNSTTLENSLSTSLKNKHALTIPFLGIYPRKKKIYRNVHSNYIWYKQTWIKSKWWLTDENCGISIKWNIFQQQKWMYTATWINFKISTQSERSQTKKSMHGIFNNINHYKI